MIKRKKLSLIITAALLVILAIVYFAVIVPLTSEADTTVSLDLIEGEAEGPNGRYLMFPQISRESLESVKVTNSEGTYTFVRDNSEDTDTFMIEGFKGISFISENFSSLVVSTGYTIARDRITTEASPEELENYGLNDPQATWTITATDGTSHTVRVGNKLISEDGYYASLEGRDSCVYVLSTSIENSVLKPVNSYVDPVVCAGMSQNSYYLADSFTVFHDGEVFVSVKQSKKENFINPDAEAETMLIYPDGYKTDDSFYFNILYSFISLKGEEAVYLGNDDSVGADYGLSDPYYTIYFTYGDSIEYYIFVSSLQDDGYYYAVSNLYDYQAIIRCSSDTFSFLESDITEWVDDYPIGYNITSISGISVENSDGTGADYKLIHGTDANDKATLAVIDADGNYLSSDDVYNLRQFYKVILSVQLGGSSNLDSDSQEKLLENSDSLITTLTLSLTDGSTKKYEFRQYSTRRALMTCNGEGSFYVLADWINKIVSDTSKLCGGIEIDPYAKS